MKKPQLLQVSVEVNKLKNEKYLLSPISSKRDMEVFERNIIGS